MARLLHRRRRAAPAPIQIPGLQNEDGRRAAVLERRAPKTPETGCLSSIFTPNTPETPTLDLVLPKTPFTNNPTTTSTSSLKPGTPISTTSTTLVTSTISISATQSSSATTHSSPTKTVFITVIPTLSTTSSSTETKATTSIPGVVSGGIAASDTAPSVAPLLESVQPQTTVNRSGAILLIVIGVLAVISLLGSLAIILNRRAKKRSDEISQQSQENMVMSSDSEPITIPVPAALDRRRTRI